ncbi:MAG: hypothetical protein ACKO58_04440 [Cyanobium sp.]
MPRLPGISQKEAVRVFQKLTDQPSSVCSKRILYDTLISSFCLDASRPEPTASADP